MIAKIVKTDETDTAGLINLRLHLMFCENLLELNGRNVGDNQTLLVPRIPEDFAQQLQGDARNQLLWENWIKNFIGHMGVTTFGEANDFVNARASTFARSTLVKLIGRPYFNVFH